jgi:excinuclease ABC subunit C
MIIPGKQISKLPEKPGIYKFCDHKGDVLYIGKAKNLRKRVSSYFTSGKQSSSRIRMMVQKTKKIDYTVVPSESDALLLENTLIKKLQPRYNVNLKDGKTYPFVCISAEAFPRIFITRNTLKNNHEYYGPFTSSFSLNLLLELINKHFFIRTCKYKLSPKNIRNKKYKRCLSYHIRICKGPCEGLQSEENYLENVGHIRKILKGKTSEVLKILKEQMKEAAAKLQYEWAAEIKNTIEALDMFKTKTTVVNPKIKNMDVFTAYSAQDIAVVNYLKINEGALVKTETLEYKKKMNESDPELILLALAEIKNRYDDLASEIILAFQPRITIPGIRFTVPKIGDKKTLLELSAKNAFYYYMDIQKKKSLKLEKINERTEHLLENLKKDLGLNTIPAHIECFDNSNIQGAFPVASMVLFINAKAKKSGYRHYNIKSVTGPDDFASMREIVHRRYKRLLDEKEKLPDLIVIDGGKGQLNAAYQSLKELKLESSIEIIAIAKKLEEIYKPGQKEALAISKKSASNRFIQTIRNEAHRFAIEHHRNQRSRLTFKSSLEEIKGIGEKSIDILLNEYRSVQKIRKLSLAELEKTIGKNRARLLFDFLAKTQDIP